MHIKFDNFGYVCCILYGCSTNSSFEYSGIVPNQPESYSDMEDWADRAYVQAYYLDSNGNLAYDANKAAVLSNGNSVSPIGKQYVKELGIFDLIYPVGSLYMSVNDVSPETLFGGRWERIEDRFILAAGSKYDAGETGGSASQTISEPSHRHSIMGTSTYTANNASSASNHLLTQTSLAGAWEKTISTMPPYLSVYVWKRLEDETAENYANFIDANDNALIDANNNNFMVLEV